MKKILQFIKNFYLPAAIILTLAFSRIIPHPWNFTPILAAGTFLGFYFRQSLFLSMVMVILPMFFGDIYFGFHNTMLFTYSALIFTTLVGKYIKSLSTSKVFIGSIISSLGFFIITNFGVWATSNMYSKNFQGLIEAYILGIPFLQNTFFSTFIYLFLFKILYVISKNKIIKQHHVA